MNLMRDHIRIVQASTTLKQKGMDFIQEHYKKSFGTTPPDEPDHLFVACVDRQDGELAIIGTIGISLWRPDKPIRLSRIYDFDWLQAPRPIVPETIFEYGRLIAIRGGVSKALIAAASQYALSSGRTSGWCEHTDAVHRICLSFGLSFFPVHSVLLNAEIAQGDREFYRRNPTVQLYMTDTYAWVSALKDSVTYKNSEWSVR
jgi:hypothetical protein